MPILSMFKDKFISTVMSVLSDSNKTTSPTRTSLLRLPSTTARLKKKILTGEKHLNYLEKKDIKYRHSKSRFFCAVETLL